MALRTTLAAAGLIVGLATLASACGFASSDSGPADTNVAVTGVERVFITRPLGASLPAILVYLEFDPAVPPVAAYTGIGSDGEIYSGVPPAESKICGFPDYLGHGPNAGREGTKRTIAFIVPDSVSLEELRWSPPAEEPARSVPLPEETRVCTPPVGSSAALTGSRTRAV